MGQIEYWQELILLRLLPHALHYEVALFQWMVYLEIHKMPRKNTYDDIP